MLVRSFCQLRQSLSHNSNQLSRGKWFGQVWSTGLLQKYLGPSTYHRAAGKYNLASQLRMLLE